MKYKEVRDLIDRSAIHQGSLREIAALLPKSDAELDAMLTEMAAKADGLHYFYVMAASLLVERKVDARQLVAGTRLLGDAGHVAAFAWHMQGDVGGNLLKAVRRGGLAPNVMTVALYLTALWSTEHKVPSDNPKVTPEIKERMREMLMADVIAAARELARHKAYQGSAQAPLYMLAKVTEDAALTQIIGPGTLAKMPPSFKGYMEEIVALARRPLAEWLPLTQSRDRISYRPMQRSVEKLGRNKPCHCGSGKRYKECCLRADEARLHLSSDVAGKTHAEVQAEPEKYMTAARLQQTQPHELAQLDASKLTPELLPDFLFRLTACSLFDELATAFEKVGVPPELEEEWKALFLWVVRAQNRNVLVRMIEAHPREREMLAELTPGVRLLFSHEWAESWIETIEEEALAALKTDDSQELQRFASAVIYSRCPALGIFVGRSMLPMVNKTDAHFLLDEILGARDRLGLSPNDPCSDMVDERFAERVADDPEELRASRQKLLRATNRERQLQAELDESQRTLAQLAQKNGAAAEEKTPAAPDNAEVVRALREKNDRLKAQLRAANAERRQNRDKTRELEEGMAKREVAKQPEPEPDEEPGVEVTLAGNQPIRLVEFPRKFAATLEEFPQKVTKAAMTLIGELAAGEPGAFVGLSQMHKCHDVLRQKVKRDYRLLFVLEAKWLRIVDFVDRRDLKATLNKLRANGLPPAETRITA